MIARPIVKMEDYNRGNFGILAFSSFDANLRRRESKLAVDERLVTSGTFRSTITGIACAWDLRNGTSNRSVFRVFKFCVAACGIVITWSDWKNSLGDWAHGQSLNGFRVWRKPLEKAGSGNVVPAAALCQVPIMFFELVIEVIHKSRWTGWWTGWIPEFGG